MSRISFSIITPSFRQLELLKLCVASVADQRGDFEVEHLVQDGGSGPDFLAWAEASAPPGWVSEPDGGMYDAINRGFRRARGDVLAWLNCDEQYLPGALDAVARAFRERPEIDILFGDVVVVGGDDLPQSYRMALVPRREHIRHCVLATFSAATFVRRKVFEGGFELDSRWRTIADAVWIDRLLERGFKAEALPRALAAFKRTGENLGQSDLAARELREWRLETRSASALRRRWWAVHHDFRKWKAGAYRCREVTVRVHAPGSEWRVERKANVNERWHAEK